MTIDQLIEAAKDLPVTPDQVESLHKLLEQDCENKITQEFLNRTYNL